VRSKGGRTQFAPTGAEVHCTIPTIRHRTNYNVVRRARRPRRAAITAAVHSAFEYSLVIYHLHNGASGTMLPTREECFVAEQDDYQCKLRRGAYILRIKRASCFAARSYYFMIIKPKLRSRVMRQPASCTLRSAFRTVLPLPRTDVPRFRGRCGSEMRSGSHPS